MKEIIYYILLGIIQGVTEFLPISSSGHIEIAKQIFNISFKNEIFFTLFLHIGTFLSTIVVYRSDLKNYLMQWRSKETRIFLTMILLSTIPAGLIALFFRPWIELFFQSNIKWIGYCFYFTAILLLASHVLKNKHKKLSFLSVFIIGMVQAVALLPGVSRSGSTISTALLMRIKPEQAAKFSFLMVLPLIMGGFLTESYQLMTEPSDTFQNYNVVALLSGFVSAFLVGWLCCKWMIKLVQKGNLYFFSLYCFIIGSIAILFL